MKLEERYKDRLYPWGLFILALGLRLFFLAQISGRPYFEVLLLDAEAYDARAREILGGAWLGSGVFYQDPLYPYFLALIYKIFGPVLAPVRLIQSILGSVNTVLVYYLGRFLGGRRVGLLAGLLYLAYGLLLYYDGLIGKDGPGLVLVDAALLAIFTASSRKGRAAWFLAGAALGLAALTRGNLLLLVPLFAVWILLAAGTGLAGRAARAALFIAGFALAVSPVTVRNWVVGHDLVLLTSQAGQNFYIGNNPRASGFFENPDRIRLNPRYEEQDFRQEALRLTGRREMKASELSSFWMKRGLNYARDNPGRTLRLLGIKTAMFFNDFEIPDNYNYYFARQETGLLGLLRLSFGLVAPLGLVGLLTLWPDRRRFFLPALFIVGYLLSIVPFHMASRYRLPAVPLLICTASVMLWWLYDKFRARDWAAAAKALVPIALLLVFCHWPFYSKGRTFDAPYTALGIASAEAGDHEKAIGYFRRALNINPDFAPARYNLGNVYLELDKHDLAEAEFIRAVKIDPHFTSAWLNLGNLYIMTGRLIRAEEVFKEALRHLPRAATAYMGLGLSYHLRGRYGQAREAFERALEIDPRLAAARYNLACALAQSGLPDQAWPHLISAAGQDPKLRRQAPDDEDLRPLGSPAEIRRRLETR